MTISVLPFPPSAPSSLPIERAILASVILDPSLMHQALEVVRDEHFADAKHRLIWAACLECWEEYGTVDLLAVREQLSIRGDLDGAGGIAYISQLDLDLPDLCRWPTYLDLIEERRVRRVMWDAAFRLVRSAQDGDEDSRVLLAAEQERLAGIEEHRGSQGFANMPTLMYSAVEHLSVPSSESVGVTTGFPDLDQHVLGLSPGQLIYIAGRPGMGKSSLANQLALAAARSGTGVAYFSLEMTRQEIGLRMLSAESGVNYKRIRQRALHDEERQKLEQARARLVTLPVYIDDSADVTPQLLASRSMRQQQREGIGLVLVDYVQLMTPSRRGGNENEEVSEISRGLKILAKRLSVPVIALSQLSRGPEHRSDRRPLLSDLRASGSLEQDADVVIFVYRDSYYSRETQEDQEEAELILAKNRGGATGTVTVVWEGRRMRFLSRDWRR